MGDFLHKAKEQVYSLLFFVRHNLHYVPYILLLTSFIAFISHVSICWGYIVNNVPVNEYTYSETYLNIYTIASHYLEPSAITLLLLTSMSFYECWGNKSKLPLIYLWIMWIIVHIDIAFLPEKDIYFYATLSMLYITFVVISTKALINRNK